MPTSPALKLGLETLGEAIQLTPAAPTLVAILITSRNILQMVAAENNLHQDEERLALRVLEVAVVYSDGVRKLTESGVEDIEIERLSDNLHRCLESISKGLQNKPKAGFFERALQKSATQKRLKGCEADLEHISLLLETQIRFRSAQMSQSILLVPADKVITQGTMEERIHQANQETIDLIKSEVLKQTRKKMHKSSFGHFPPAASPIFYGRSHQVNWLVESLVNVPAYHAILGLCGIGKTSVALNMLHDPRIIEVYGKHRYFLACETTTDVGGIIAGMANIFSLNENSFVKAFKRLCDIIQSNILFLLDNFETPWERMDARQNVEDLLTDLSSIPNLSIVFTLRGAERPSGIRWSRPFFPVLGPLDLVAARQTFVTISDIGSDNADVDQLLEAVEFIPLAITLLAAQASYTNCAFLLEQWKTCKTSMITRGWDSRLSSLDVSISLSLTSSRFTSNPQALSLLQVLSLLPDGATMEELCNMTAGNIDIDVHRSVSTLLQVALASISLHDRVCVLAPIREYVQMKEPIPQNLLQYVLSYHAELSRQMRESQWTAEKMNMDEKLKTCVGNIHCVIRFSLDVGQLTNDAINATIDVATFRRFSNSGSISHLLEQSVNIARGSQNLMLLAACLIQIGVRRWYGSPDHMSALGCLEESANILRPLSSPESRDLLISALNNLCWIMNDLQRSQEAVQVAQESVGLISLSTSPVISALAYLRFGFVLAFTGNYPECQKALERASSYINPKSHPFLSLRLSDNLCRMYAARDMYGQSATAADIGLSLPTEADLERAVLLVARGELCIALSRYEDARRHLHEALQFLASCGSVAAISVAHYSIGMSHLSCGNFTDAALSFHTAHHFHVGYVDPAHHPILGLATVELYQNTLDESLIYLDSASKQFSEYPPISIGRAYWLQIRCQVQIRQRKEVETLSACVITAVVAHGIQDRSLIALSILLLGDYFLFLQKDVSTAKGCYGCCLELGRYIGNRRWIASTLLRIGVTDYLQGDLSLAHRRLNQAAGFYEETNGQAWVDFCKDVLQLIGNAVHHDDIPFFPPVNPHGF